MYLYNFQILEKFLAAPVEIADDEKPVMFQGSTWRLRQMVEVPYPEPSHSFCDRPVPKRLLRVVKVPYPQPEHSFSDSAVTDPLQQSRDFFQPWDPVGSVGNPHHPILSPTRSEPFLGPQSA